MKTRPTKWIAACSVVSAALGACAADQGRNPGGHALRVVGESFGQQWTGIAVSRSGRKFVCSPNWHDGHYWSVAELKPDGSVVPYPDQYWNRFDARLGVAPADQFVCVQSVYVDSADRLWVLDPASPRLAGVLPGGAKLLQFDLGTDTLVRRYEFDEKIAPRESYLNDIRVDARRSFAYITDSGLGAIVALDLSAGQARRFLANDPRTKAEDIVPIIEGRELRFASGPSKGKVPQIHADGIALSRDGDWLYWQALTARTLYRAPTEVFRDPTSNDARAASMVQKVGPSVMTDGMEIDAGGTVYFTALEKGAIIARRPDGSMLTVGKDPRIIWPDSFAWGRGGELFFTTAQINRTPWFSPWGTMPTTPYLVFQLQPPP